MSKLLNAIASSDSFNVVVAKACNASSRQQTDCLLKTALCCGGKGQSAPKFLSKKTALSARTADSDACTSMGNQTSWLWDRYMAARY